MKEKTRKSCLHLIPLCISPFQLLYMAQGRGNDPLESNGFSGRTLLQTQLRKVLQLLISLRSSKLRIMFSHRLRSLHKLHLHSKT